MEEVRPPLWKSVGLGVLGAGALGAGAGAIWGSLSGHSTAAFALGMGSNWATVAGPFLLSRSLILSYRESLNAKHGIPDVLARERDDLLASTLAGALTGVGLGYFYRGWRALPSGVILWGSLAFAGQGLINLGKRKRLEWALAAQRQEETGTPSRIHFLNTPARNMTKFRFLGTDERPTVAGTKWDPAKVLFDAASDWIASKIDLPPWASPLVNAVDIEYRRKLNFSIDLLENQVRDLKMELEEKAKAKELKE